MLSNPRNNFPAPDDRAAQLRKRLAELEQLLASVPDEEPEPAAAADKSRPVATGPSDRTLVRFPDGREILVVIGTSEMAEAAPGLVDRICEVVSTAYSNAGKHKRVDRYDAMHRLKMGDAGPQSNRVLHLAYKEQVLVGCASSTFSPGWTPDGCGHWGLLAVDPASQGCGVATALVLAAERRLATVSDSIQIEYSHSGDEFSERLMQWYEDKLGFNGGPRRGYGFRHCRKSIPEDEQRKGRRRRIVEVRAWLEAQLAETEAQAGIPVPMDSESSDEDQGPAA